MKVKIKKLHPDAVIPQYAKAGDAGMDLVATSYEWDMEDVKKHIYGTGLAIEIPEGYVGLIFPRSSIHKKDLLLINSIGVIDSGYRGEIKFIFKNAFQEKWEGIPVEGEVYRKGDRIGQLIIMPYPQIEFEEVEDLSDTERGVGGFGSTGD